MTGQGEKSSLFDLARAVADGEAVDWRQIEETPAEAPESGLIAALREVSTLSAAFRRSTVGSPRDAGSASYQDYCGFGERWGPLDLREKIGSGVYGQVYHAHHRHLQVDVALKLLGREGSVAGAALERTLDEARMLARIRHPHVVQVYGAEMHGGRAGLWMELVEGRDLATIVGEDGPFSASEAALIGIDLCTALAAVHGAGLVHRDVKAQNVRRETGGRIVLMDFGAGVSHDGVGGGSGSLVGTPVYMAPEVLAGADTTPRSDLWSLGVLLFFLVTGEYPFHGHSISDVRQAQQDSGARSLSDIRPDLPSEFTEIVERALAADTEERFASAGAMAEALRGFVFGRPRAPVAPAPGAVRRQRVEQEKSRGRVFASVAAARSSARSRRRLGGMLALGAATVVVASVVGTLIWKADRPDGERSRTEVVPVPTEGIRSVAVLPLLNLSKDPEQQYFADGMTEALISDLARISPLKVISRTSSMRFRDTSLSLPEIARELGVDAVVEGSVQREDDSVRITAKLIDAATDRQIWGDTLERELAGALQLQSEVARSVADAIAATISTGERRLLANTREVNPETYEAYLRGKHLIDKGTPESLAKGMAYLQKAVDLDPTETLAYAGLASGNVMLSHATGDAEYVRRAKAAARRALELDVSNPEAHAVQAMVAMYFDRDWEGADKAFRRAIELNPSEAEIHVHYAFLLILHASYTEAAAHIELARKLDPLSPTIAVFRAEFYWPLGRYEQAAEAASRSLELSPGFPYAHAWLGQAYRGLRRYEEALEHARIAAAGNPRWMPYLGLVLVEAGHRGEARALLEELVATAEDRILVELAYFQAAFGDLAGAMASLERADKVRELYLPWIGSVFEFGELTGDPRFRKLLEKMDLEIVRPQLLAAAAVPGANSTSGAAGRVESTRSLKVAVGL